MDIALQKKRETAVHVDETLHRFVRAEPLGERLLRMEERVRQAGDHESGKKLRELAQKLKQREYAIALCGHFSAGKSSMINRLLGCDLLPTGPVPTSANVVKVCCGPAPEIRVRKRSGEETVYADLEDFSMLQQQMKDGETVEKVEIVRSEGIPEGIAVMDTPGIDSTDEAHKRSAESALHLADLILYVMDYNHVQSEINYRFLERLQKQRKTIWLIVNQMDKHRDFELSVEAFKESVKQSFAAWGIEPEDIFFTSLLKPEWPGNEWERVNERMQATLKKRTSLMMQNVLYSAAEVIAAHQQWWRKNAGDDAEERNVAEERRTLEYRREQLLEEREREHRLAKTCWEDFGRELQAILFNANLTPFETREAARLYLESLKPGFKVGWFLSGKKTKEEKARRLKAAVREFQEKVKAGLDWHIKDLLQSFAKRYELEDETFLSRVFDLTVPIDETFIAGRVKTGALTNLTGDYVLQYAKELAQAAKSEYKRKALALMEEALEPLRDRQRKKTEGLDQQIEQIERRLSEMDEKLAWETKEREQIRTLTEWLHTKDSESPDEEEPKETEFTGDWFSRAAAETASTVSAPEPASAGEKEGATLGASFVPPDDEGTKEADRGQKDRLQRGADRLLAAAELLEPLEGCGRKAEEMRSYAKRLQERRFTVALFGAFSAGKSSFANVLLGDMVLPVSPNPTTAAINKMMPPDETNPHRKVRIRLKDEESILSDVCHSLKKFGYEAETMEEALALIPTIEWTEGGDRSAHRAFLEAVQRGYSRIRSQLGQTKRVDMSEFERYAAQEETACFVDVIELYYDCPITARGISIVDTPGADSVNARHSDVAFRYIKEADAVLFVTYYNHSFSRADKEFLMQLGRVKDTFEMDKMFFIVNAADLAKNEAELREVTAHVEERLLACGIRHPRIYPVSSQTAILARLHKRGKLATLGNSAVELYKERSRAAGTEDADAVLHQSGIRVFESDFMRFTVDELTQVALQSVGRMLSGEAERLEAWIRQSQRDQREREEEQKRLQQAEREIVEDLERWQHDSKQEVLEKEVKELLYYVKQRVSYRLSDFFLHAFHPSVLKDDAGDIKRKLRLCLQDFLQSVHHEFMQELRATALRLDRFLQKLMEDRRSQAAQEAEKKLGYALSHAPDTPEFSAFEPDIGEGISAEDLRPVLKTFKNAKDFFEKEGNRKMKTELENRLQEPMTLIIRRCEEDFLRVYGDRLQQLHQREAQAIKTDVGDHVKGALRLLSGGEDAERLRQVCAELRRLESDG